MFFWYGCTPWKQKKSPKPGQVSSQITNPKPGQILICYKNAAQIRGNLLSEQIIQGQNDETWPNAGAFFVFGKIPNPMPGLGNLCRPITGGGGILTQTPI